MEQSTFHALLTESGAVTDPEPVADATLETLGDALSAGEADAVARRLPERYGDALATAGEAQPLDYEAFLERVEERIRERTNGSGDAIAGPDGEGDVRAQAAAVADALAVALPPDELFDLRSGLPPELEALFAEGENVR